ncbi:copper homeostasis protein CutC [Mucilaginibacter galii]|uniref:PF03932 family protein CutC n=1 Tax=Mucilaginibacter galii TaxID=2005073 RepID=A0A917J981_9SPHI|nr:copper homeostasis protein CutC [Mucilaginibacter galii]GGI50472.1 copper homeostasis protein CutC [Mucilaginibacter galii]
MNILLEVCANSAQSAIAAQNGGAHRVELCDNLHEGGTTPSYGQISATLKYLTIPVHVLLRPRPGDFLYTDLEFEVIKSDLEMCGKLGCAAIVTGVLNADGTIDKTRCAELVQLAKQNGLKTTFHRAFDLCADMFQALDEIIELGFDCILTSGGKTTAIEGASKIAQLIQRAAGRISIMPGGGISEYNAADIVHFTGATEIHSSARVRRKSNMQFHNDHIIVGGSFSDEYDRDESDEERVKSIILKANEQQTD